MVTVRHAAMTRRPLEVAAAGSTALAVIASQVLSTNTPADVLPTMTSTSSTQNNIAAGPAGCGTNKDVRRITGRGYRNATILVAGAMSMSSATA